MNIEGLIEALWLVRARKTRRDSHEAPPEGITSPIKDEREGAMLRGAALFYVIAVIASFLGFGEVAFTAGIIAKVLFFVFLALFLFTLSAGLLR